MTGAGGALALGPRTRGQDGGTLGGAAVWAARWAGGTELQPRGKPAVHPPPEVFTVQVEAGFGAGGGHVTARAALRAECADRGVAKDSSLVRGSHGGLLRSAESALLFSGSLPASPSPKRLRTKLYPAFMVPPK